MKDLILLSIGAVIGAGIFSSIGTAAAGEILPDGTLIRAGAGPALVLSFLLIALVCGLCALAYAELSSMIPQAGSAYTYTYATLGELVAWIVGWNLLLEYAVGNIAVAIACSPCQTVASCMTPCTARMNSSHPAVSRASCFFPCAVSV